MNPTLPGKLYFPFLVQMVVTRKCNLACGYCHENDRSAAPVPLAQLKRQVDILCALGTLILTLTGGEPLLHPEVIELLNYAKRKFLAVGMITNAYLLNDAMVEKLNAAHLTSLQISIDGVVPGSMTVKSLKLLRGKLEMIARKAVFKVNLNSVIGPTPPSELVEIFEFARSHGFSSTAQVIHDDHGQNLLGEADRQAYFQIMQKYCNPVWNLNWSQTRSLILTGKAPFKCRAGSRFLYINEFGEVCWCAPTQNLFHKPLENYTPDDLKTEFYREKGCEECCTIGCVRTSSALEGFRRYGVPVTRSVVNSPTLTN